MFPVEGNFLQFGDNKEHKNNTNKTRQDKT